MPYDFSRLKILIIDDNAFMRVLLREMFKVLGFNADNLRAAVDGQDAIDTLAGFDADLAICDWLMAPMNGRSFTMTVRKGVPAVNPLLPIIACTAFAERRHVEEARDAGVNEILVKPVSAEDLYERTRSIIERPRPFIRAQGFIGPDRRRLTRPFRGPDRRRTP